jgi:diguanylate cyclase (GGDEF)-like protein
MKSSQRSKPLILVVDDDPFMRLMEREALEQAGFAVEEAENGAQAVAACAALRPDLVITDVQMPEMDGFTACTLLRHQPGGGELPILILTGLDDAAAVAKAYDAGATDFSTKPVNGLLLGQRVRYLLRTSEMLQTLRKSQASLARAQRIARLGDWEWDAAARTFDISGEVAHLLGFPPGTRAIRLEDLLAVVHPDDQSRFTAALEHLPNEPSTQDFECRTIARSGTERIMRIRTEWVQDRADADPAVVGTIQDITDRKRAEERMHFLAYYDALTSLPNRRLFQDRLTQTVALARRQHTLGAVCLLSLNGFQRIHDTFGRAAADALLQTMSRRLASGLRASDSIGHGGDPEAAPTLSHFGSDEFSVLLAQLRAPQDAAIVAQRLLDALADPFPVGEQEVFLTTSMGISIFPAEGDDEDRLLKQAGAALRHAQQQPGSAYQFYSDQLNASAAARVALESALRKAIERREFLLHYQPQVNFRTGAIVGAEALIRWRRPGTGLVPPGEFIPLAEETGLIVPIGEWALQAACEQSRAWHALGLPPMRMAVNLSGVQFNHPGLANSVRRVLAETGMPAPLLELELTETIMMRDVQRTIDMLQAFKAMGVRLAMDDFGTGYSSLASLSRFPLDTLKVDRAFVKDIAGSVDAAALTSAIIAMAHILKLTVLAEGIETQGQWDVLLAQGCDEMQGYLFSKPLPADDFERLLLTRATEPLAAVAAR